MIGLLNGNFMQGESRMSLLAMDTSSLFDPFAYPPEIDPEPPKPEAKFREKLEIKPLRHQEPQVKTYFALREPEFKTRENQGVSVKEVVDVTTHHYQSKLKMVDTLSPQPASDMHTVRQKLRDSLTSALEMVVSKQLVKNVLGVVKDSKKDVAEIKSMSKFEVSHPDSVLQENGDANSNRQNGDDSLVVDLGFLDNEAGNKDEIGGESPFPDQLLFNGAEAGSNYDQLERSENTDVAESPLKKLKTQFGNSDSFHRKLEIEEKEGRIAVEDVKGGLHLMDQARKLATVIEAELFKLYGFKKTYNQKARSLLFNLKDKSNPELRARVFSGEITPADLCRMSAEQLASKELSDWRNAKEQALDKWVVLTDADVVSGKVVKKTHKGEFVVDVQNENTVDIIPVVTRSVFPQKDKLEAKSENVAPEHMETSVNDTADFRILNSPHSGSSPSLKRSRSGNSTHLESSQITASKPEEGLVPSESTPERSDPELMEVEKGLPAILSLDEYMDAQVNDSQSGYQEDVFEDAPIEPRASVKHTHSSEVHEALDISGSPNPYKANEDAGLSNSVKSPSAKDGEDANAPVKQISDPVISKREEAGVVWAGQIQFSSNRQSTLSVIYQSGERVDLKNWPKSLELKGRVRLAHLDKFLQDLQQSRSRAVTVVSLFVQEGIADQKNVAAHVKEVSSQYQMGDRVGFVEPRSGYELYLLPPGTGTMKLLSEHGHPEILSESQGREVVLVGVIVWRKSQLSTSRLPDRNNNVKRHAVASSSHHESISKSSRAGVGLGKDPAGSDHRPSLRGGPPNVSSALSSMHLTKFQVESPTKEDTSLLTRNLPPLTPTNANVLNSHHVSHAAIKPPSDTSADIPPGFSLRQSDSSLGPSVALRQSPSLSAAQGGRDAPPGFWPRAAPQSTLAQRPLLEDDDDDDDLPEFDFGGQSVSGGLPPSTQFSGSNLSGHPTQFQARPGPSPAESHTPPNSSEFPPAAGFPPGLPPPPPPSQDPTTFLRRNPPPYANGGGPVVAISGVGQGQGQGQVMLGHLGPPPLQANVAQYSGVSPPPPPLPPPQQGNPLPRNDLPEWCPSAQFQLWPPPVYETDPRQMGAAPSRPPFDPSGPPLPMQEINWPPSQQQPPPQQQQQQQQHQQQHQQHPSLPLPPPPHYVQEPPRNFQPPQWQQQQQQQQQQHSSHFQQQQHLPARPSDLRGSYGWESAAPAWDASTRGGREPAGGGSIEQNRDTRSRVEPAAARAKDPRMSELSWHERERDQNGGRPEFGRR